jgi:broad specificity phosphatase PhoE
MLRAIETAELLQSIGIGSGPIDRWDDLNEMKLGLVSGLTEIQIRVEHPQIYQLWTMGKVPAFPQGETPGELAARIGRVLFTLLQGDMPTIVVAHKTVLRAMRVMLGIPVPRDEGHLSGLALWTPTGGDSRAVWRNISPQRT